MRRRDREAGKAGWGDESANATLGAGTALAAGMMIRLVRAGAGLMVLMGGTGKRCVLPMLDAWRRADWKRGA